MARGVRRPGQARWGLDLRVWASGLALTLFTISPVGAQRAEPTRSEADSLHREGLQALEEDRPEVALGLFADAWINVRFTDPVNRSLGIDFIELAVARGRSQHFEAASEAYLWALSSGPLDSVFRDEYARLRPLLEEAAAERLDALLASNDQEILRELRRFWIEADPTPTTGTNERLIEHWERISHAREHFRMGSNSPYRTDDRGTTYVRFGPPQETWEGSLGANENELRMWVDNVLAREQLRRYDTYPRYEVWIYDILDKEEFAYVLFGNVDGSGPFVEVEGVDELIPHQARSAASRSSIPGGVRASHYLRFFYYSDLERIGGPFARRFSEMNIEWSRAQARGSGYAPNESTLKAFETKYQQEDRTSFGPTDRVPFASSFDSLGTSLEMVATVMRILGADGTPQVRIVSLAAPYVAVDDVGRWFSEGRTEEIPLLRQFALVRDGDLEVMGEVKPTAVSRVGDVATYLLRHPHHQLHLTLVAHAQDPAALGRVQSGGTEAQEVVFPSRRYVRLQSPLSSDPGVLEMSDIVTGIAFPEEQLDSALGLPLIPSRSVHSTEAFRLYFEVYHLETGPEAVGRYAAQIRVEAWDLREGRPRSRPEPVAVAYDIETTTRTDHRVFDLAVANLAPGDYRLTVEVVDERSGGRQSRSSLFTIRED